MEPGSLRAATAAATVQQMTDTLTHSPSNLSSSTDDQGVPSDLNGVGSSEDSLGGKWSSDDRLSQPTTATTSMKTTSTKSLQGTSEDEEAAYLIEEGSEPPVRQPEVIPITG